MTRQDAPGLVTALALVWLLALGACADRPGDVASYHEWFNDLRSRMARGDESAQAVHAGSLEALPIVRIELNIMTIGYFLESMDITFESPERATRQGGLFDWPAETKAPLTAKVPFHEFAKLCWFIESLDLPSTSQKWRSNVDHGDQVDISWTTRDGRTVELSSFAGAAPPAVEALAEAIQNTARGLRWTPAEATVDEASR